MPAFQCSVVDIAGRKMSVIVEAADATAARAVARRDGLLVVRVVPRTAAGTLLRSSRVSARDAHSVARSLATLLPAGLALPRALETTAQIARPAMAAVLDELKARVMRGERLADVLATQPSVFSPHFVGIVRAGETSGDLSNAFVTLAAQLERDEETATRFYSAMLYPAVLAVAGGAAMLVLLLLVIPQFALLLGDAGATLPASTAFVLRVSAALRWGWWTLPIIVAAAVGSILFLSRDGKGRRALASAMLTVPLLGLTRREIAAARFARLAGTLVSGGSPLLSALDDTARSLADPLAADATSRVRVAVREGVALHAAVAREAYFPPMLARLIALGEESARLGEFLSRAARFFEDATERRLRRLVSLAEPAMIVCFGSAVGFVALALLQAIYSVNAGTFR